MFRNAPFRKLTVLLALGNTNFSIEAKRSALRNFSIQNTGRFRTPAQFPDCVFPQTTLSSFDPSAISGSQDPCETPETSSRQHEQRLSALAPGCLIVFVLPCGVPLSCINQAGKFFVTRSAELVPFFPSGSSRGSGTAPKSTLRDD